MVSVLAFYSDDPSSNPLKSKIVVEKNENKHNDEARDIRFIN